MLTIEKKSLKVGRFVDTNHVNAVIRRYKEERWQENSKRIGKDDSLSVWYSVEELEEFIGKIKSHGANGIRFYFGEYPAGFGRDQEATHRQTIVLVATKSKEEGPTDSKDIYINDGEKTTILAYNVGGLCPVYCSGKGGGVGTDGDTWGDIGTTLVDRGDDGMIVV